MFEKSPRTLMQGVLFGLNQYNQEYLDHIKCVVIIDVKHFFKQAFCFQVKKIYENEKRLQAGDHNLDLLALDFEKNYNMYIFPVHWQFGQLDQHPSDGYVLTGINIFS